MSSYKIQKVGSTTVYDIETQFGLKVKALSGLANQGKLKGVTTEEFADASGKNIHVFKNTNGSINRDSTNFTLEVFFDKSERYTKFRSLLNFMSGMECYLSDTDRGIKAKGWALEATEPTDFVERNNEYLLSTIKFENVYGDFETI